MTDVTQWPAAAHDAAAVEFGVAVTALRLEHLGDALGLGTPTPRLSWVVETERPDWMQAGYEIATLGPDGAVRAQTGAVASGQSVLVPWPFPPL